MAFARQSQIEMLIQLAAALALALLPTAPPLRAGSPRMLARRPKFKGGNLDDFLAAGDAEAKFGPGRYAAVAEDAWKIETKRAEGDVEKARSLELYSLQKTQWLSDHVFISLLGVAGAWSVGSAFVATSFAFGTFFGGLYIYLKQREVDGFNPTSVEEARSGPPALLIPAIMILACAKNPDSLSVVPALAGFFMQKVAAVGQLVYNFDREVDQRRR